MMEPIPEEEDEHYEKTEVGCFSAITEMIRKIFIFTKTGKYIQLTS
jgi:hypothetical protein